MKKEIPSMDQWLKEAKEDPAAANCGMFLVHNGTVRQTAKAKVRQGQENTAPVTGMFFRYDAEKVEQAIAEAKRMAGIYYTRVWLNEGELTLGDDIMFVLVGGDIRPHVIDALQTLVGTIKNKCVVEQEVYGALFPNRPAVIDHETRLSYRQFDELTDRFATALLRKGIGHGDHVVLFGEAEAEVLALFFAIQRIGAVAVMVNTALVRTDLETVLRLGDPKLICIGISYQKDRSLAADVKALGSLPAIVEGVFTMGSAVSEFYPPLRAEESKDEEAVAEAEKQVRCEDTAVIIFTSDPAVKRLCGKLRGCVLRRGPDVPLLYHFHQHHGVNRGGWLHLPAG